MAGKRSDFTFSQLALMNWLMEKPDRFISTSTYANSPKNIHFYEAQIDQSSGQTKGVLIYPLSNFGNENARKLNVEFLKALGGRDNIDVTALHQAGLVTSHSSFSASEYSRAFFKRINMAANHNGERFDLPTRKMARFWAEAGKAAYEEERANLQKKAAEVRREIVIGRKLEFNPDVPKELTERWPKGLALPYPKVSKVRPSFSATVTKVTPTRVYVEDVKCINDVDRDYYVIKGYPPNQYVERTEVVADYADEALIEKLVDLDREFQTDIDRISTETIKEMLPLVTNIDSRFKQKEAEHDDMMRDLIEQHSNAIGKGPKR